MRLISSISFICLLFIFGCKNVEEKDESQNIEGVLISKDLNWSERMMLSEIERFPKAWQLDFHDKPVWSYPNGLVLKGTQELFKKTGKEVYHDYIFSYTDALIDSTGNIKTYKPETKNLAMLKSGHVLLWLYEKTGEEKYKKAADKLINQLIDQPRTKSGGFWHKKRYTNQMWLDGLYMAHPFYARYAGEFEKDSAQKVYDDIIHQFDLTQKHHLDKETGLLYHGWDESKEQKWANPKTGTSPNFWSRAMGWYGMALVDVLDYLPEDYKERKKIIGYLRDFAETVVNYQDESGLWYQVLDRQQEEGNYLEASGSAMFVYTLAKGGRKGYLNKSYLEDADKGYRGILNKLISVEDNGIVNLNQVCAVAGLGGDPYRDGSFEYYVNEEIRPNDPKGTGPFILASLEMENK